MATLKAFSPGIGDPRLDTVEDELGLGEGQTRLELRVEDLEAGGGTGASNASATVKGISKLSVAPVSATDPIAAGTNDSRLNAAADLATHSANVANPHAVSKSQVGLGSADNTSDASKPVSSAQQTALDAKAASVHTHLQSDVTDLVSALAAKATEAVRAASGKGYVNHGSTAGTARPAGYASVEWVGSVEPTNSVNGDTWVNTV